jgi:hypothetical protein
MGDVVVGGDDVGVDPGAVDPREHATSARTTIQRSIAGTLPTILNNRERS